MIQKISGDNSDMNTTLLFKQRTFKPEQLGVSTQRSAPFQLNIWKLSALCTLHLKYYHNFLHRSRVSIMQRTEMLYLVLSHYQPPAPGDCPGTGTLQLLSGVIVTIIKFMY